MNKTDLLRNIISKQKPSFNQSKLATKVYKHYPGKFTNVDTVRKYINRIANINAGESILEIKKQKTENTKDKTVLAVGDLHAPFDLEEYFDFIKAQADKYQPDKIVFMGDIVDNHAMCFHDVNVDGYSAGYELSLARERLERYYNEFPIATVILGNHDAIPFRKATRYGISQHVLKNPQEIWHSPDTWKWTEELWINDVGFHHGTARGKAYTLAGNTQTSTVHAHWHGTAGIQYYQKRNSLVFGMQVGCGVDGKKYAFEYAKSFKNKPIISCGVVFNSERAIVITMDK